MKKNKKFAFFILISLILQLFSGINFTNIAKADVINDFKFITSVTLTDTNDTPLGENIDKSSGVKIRYDFKIPNDNNIKDGDVYTNYLPKQIALQYPFSLNIEDGNNNKIAVASFDTSGKIEIKFTDYVSTHSNVQGYFQFEGAFDKNNIGNGESEKIEFKLGAETQPIIVEVKFKQDPLPETSIKKSGVYNQDKNEITWNIVFNSEKVNVKDAKIIDNIPFGQEYVNGTALLDGQPISLGLSYTKADASNKETSGTLTYEFADEVNEEHSISFKTKISDRSILASENNWINLTNQAKLEMTGGEKTSNTATVSVQTDYIKKSGSYDASTKQINWTIDVNNNNLELNNFKVEDIIPTGLDVIAGTFKVNSVVDSNYTYQNNNLSYTFVQINKKQTITFSTKILDNDFYKDNKYVTYTNKANGYVENVLIASDNSNGVGVTSTILKKYGSGYDTKTHYITWEIKVNSNLVEIINPVIQDIIPEGQRYVKDSFKIVGSNADTSGFSYVDADSSDKTKTGTINFNFNKTINTEYTITFQTEVLSNESYANNKTTRYSNTATMKADNLTKELNSQGTQDVISQVISKTNIGYNYTTKELTWKIVVNNNATKLKNVVITDIIPLEQEYIGTVSITPNNANVITDYAKGSRTLSYSFNNEINEKYEITFKTKIIDNTLFNDNKDITVKNKAEITGDVIPSNVSSEGKTTVKNSVISKTAAYTDGNDYIDWKVSINSNAVPIGEAIIEDNLQEGLQLDTTSVQLFNGLVNSGDGSLSATGQAIELNQDSVKYDKTTRKFKFKFNNEVNSPYILTFRTYVTDKTKSPFTNIAYFEGSNIKGSSTSNQISVRFQSGSSGGIGELGSITVNKLDEANKTKLKGAKFNLLDRYKNLVESAETDENGTLTFEGIRFDIPYYVEEISAPIGYLLKENNIQQFVIKSADGSKNITQTFYNKAIKGSIELNKVDEDEKPLKGVEFTLYDSTGAKVISSESNDNGIVTFKDIPYGNYTVKETKPLEGYLKNDTIYSFEIKEDGKTVKSENSVENKIIRGNIKVVKVDEDNKFLSNAYITLVDLDGNVVQTAITDANGEVTFTNVPYGKYKVKETKAPEGYNLSEEVLDVNIDKEETNELYEAGTITNTKIKANIKINKLDQDNNKVVGAEFTLCDKNDNPITTAVTNTDGIALFEDVVYGDYYIKETKTPEGYIGTNREYDVSIKLNNVEKSLEINNTKIKGSLEITKQDGNENPLSGAEFTVYDQVTENEVAHGVTDKNGVARFENLVYGNYYYVETKAPEGYVLNSDRHDFEIKDNGVVLKETVKNEQIVGNIKVVKLDEEGKFLANAEFTLYDLQGNLVQVKVTDENGLATFENVVYGDYEVKETRAPEGYNLSDKVLKVSINKEDTGVVYEAGTITNTKIKANIKINKLDQDKNKVIGAEFTLYNSFDKVIAVATTNTDGIALFEDVVYGDYYIKETKTPEGYIGTDEKIEVSIKENNSVYSYEIENTRIKGTIEINKVDENGNPLKGAEFALYSKDGKEISKVISDEKGIARFEAVNYGNYVIKETKAPEGYLKEETEVEVVVDSQKTQVFTFKNNKIQDGTDNLGKGGLPSTGSAFDSKLLLIVGLVLVLAGSGFMLKRKVKVNK